MSFSASFIRLTLPLTLLSLLGADLLAQERSDPALERARALAAEAIRAQGISGLGAIYQLQPVLSELDAEAQVQVLSSIASQKVHPEVRTAANLSMARTLLDQAHRPQAMKLVGQEGFVHQWHVVGPFPNDAMKAMETPLRPELALNLKEPLKGRHFPVRWQDLGGRSDLEKIDLQTLIRPIEGSVAYAATVIRVRSARKVVLRIAATAAYKVWVGGRLVGSEDEELGGPYDRDFYGLKLEKGDHLLLAKLGNADGPMTFSLRFTDERGAPALGPRCAGAAPCALEAINTPEAIQAAAARATQNPTPIDTFSSEGTLSRLERLARRAPTQGRATALARTALAAHLLRPGDPNEPGVDLMRAATALKSTREVLLIQSRIAASQWERRDAIEQAWRLAPADPWTQFRLAQTAYRSVGDAEYARAWALLRHLEERHPGFVSAQAMLAGMLQDEGLTTTAMELASRLSSTHPRHARSLGAAWSAAQAVGDPSLQLELCRKQRLVDAANIAIYGTCSSLLLKSGQADEALAMVTAAIETLPNITGFYALLADVHFARAEHSQSQEALLRLTQTVPGEASYWRQLALAQLRQGRTSEAIEAMTAALKIEPRNSELRDHIENLRPKKASAEAAWAISPLPRLSDEEADSTYAQDNIVVLVDQKVVRVYPNGLTSTFVQRAWKIRTDAGLNAARSFQIPYTPGEEDVEVVRARVTRGDGAVRESYQVFEESLSEPWYNLYYDYKAMVLVFPDLSVGDTVEVQYRVAQTASQNILGDYFGDMWYVQEEAPKLIARYVLLSPEGQSFEVRGPQLDHAHKTELLSRAGEKITARSWTFEKTPRIKPEGGEPGLSELTDYIHISTYSSWDEIARWYWALVKDQLVVDSEITRIVKEATAGISDRRQKVSAIHNWVVQNTRYVGLEFGIHGYKPYRTTHCLKRRFGDCKDKASLIKVMLNEAGIDANIVLTRTRNNGAIDGEPASLQIFDHAIAYVPDFDLFLDGTAEYSGTAELPWADQGVTVLIVKDGGGHILRKTSIAPAGANAILSRFDVDFSGETAIVDVSTSVTGAFAAGYRQKFGTASKQKEQLEQEVAKNFRGARLTYHQLSDLEKLEEDVRISYRSEGGELLRVEGEVLSFLPTLRDSNLSQRMAPWTARNHPLELGHPFTTQETFSIKLPSGKRLVGGPTDVEIKSPFGRFEVQTRSDEKAGEVVVSVTLRVDAHRVTAAQYPKFRAWVGEIDRVLGTRLVAGRRGTRRDGDPR